MKVTVIGVGRIDVEKSKKTGNPFHATVLHGKYKDGQVTGEAVDSFILVDNLNLSCIPELKPGQIVDIEYNKNGFVCGVEIQK